MPKVCFDIPLVSQCAVSDCVYNINKGCHANAITVGDGSTPDCDTYMGAASHTRKTQVQAGVGACKVTSCTFNDDFECSAKGIEVGYQNTNVHCLTFHPR